MARHGTYGDHLTLQAAADVFNIQIVIYSTLRTMATQTISPRNSSPIATFYLGHFTELEGITCASPTNVEIKQFQVHPTQSTVVFPQPKKNWPNYIALQT